MGINQNPYAVHLVVAVDGTPDREIGIEPLFLQDPDVPPGQLPRYGEMAARFYLAGMTRP